jgi:hypothetical protein
MSCSICLPTPPPCSSLRQVYKARLRRDGTLVAVKVQRPGIVEQISLDFYLVRGACQFVDKYVDAITTPLVPLLDEFAGRVYQELNYAQVSHALRATSPLSPPCAGRPFLLGAVLIKQHRPLYFSSYHRAAIVFLSRVVIIVMEARAGPPIPLVYNGCAGRDVS